MTAKRENATPWGVPRVLVAVLYFLVVCVTGMALGAPEPLQRLMEFNGAFGDLEAGERVLARGSVMNFGLSLCVLSGVLVGPLIELIGTKATGLLGLALHSGGYCLLFFTHITFLYYAAGFCLGLGFQCIVNSHMTVGCLFPRQPNLILALIGAGPDVSYAFPLIMRYFAEHYGGTPEAVKKVVMHYLLFLVLPAALIDVLFLPVRPFKSPGTPSVGTDTVVKNVESTPLLSTLDGQGNQQSTSDGQFQAIDTSVDTGAVEESAPGKVSPVVPFAHLSVRQQLMTFDYWVFIPFALITYLRKKHTSVSIRPILSELDSSSTKNEAKFYTEFYNNLVPYGFIPAIIWGILVDRYGIIPLMFVSNILGVIYTSTFLLPSMMIQGFTIIVFIIYQAFVFGQFFAFCASTYGFGTLAKLQGTISTITGVFSLVMDYVWPKFVLHTLGSNRNANFFLLAVGVVLFSLPATLHLLSTLRARKAAADARLTSGKPVALHKGADADEYDGDTAGLINLYPTTTCYDRSSIAVLEQRASLALSHRSRQHGNAKV